MSKIRSKAVDEASKATERFARKNRLARRKFGLEIGDRIRIIDIDSDLKDPNYDLQDSEHREMRTAELFRFCLGREFTVRDFGRYGTVELAVGANREVRKKFGKDQRIWLVPAHLKVVRKKGRGK
jgi:hypothetical protein